MSWGGFGSLNLSNVEAEQGRKTLKPGSYTCKITGAEVRETRDKTGHGLLVSFEEVNGAGSTQEFININNRNPDATRIGLQRLKALLIACGHPNPDRPGDVKTLVNRVVGVHVEQGPDFVDKNGQTRPGGGKPRSSGAYYKPENVPASQSSGQSNRAAYLDDDIPF